MEYPCIVTGFTSLASACQIPTDFQDQDAQRTEYLLTFANCSHNVFACSSQPDHGLTDAAASSSFAGYAPDHDQRHHGNPSVSCMQFILIVHLSKQRLVVGNQTWLLPSLGVVCWPTNPMHIHAECRPMNGLDLGGDVDFWASLFRVYCHSMPRAGIHC